MHRGHHATIQFVTGLVHSGSVHEDDLSLGECDDSQDLEAGRLRLVRDRRDLFSDQTIQQG